MRSTVAAATLIAGSIVVGSAAPCAAQSKGEEITAGTPRTPGMRYPPSRARVPLILGGLGLTATAYAIGAACAVAWPTVPGSKGLYAPVVGPWIALGKSGCSPENPDCNAILYVRGGLYILSALVQMGGLAIATEGIIATTEADAPEPKKKKSGIVVMPLSSPHLTGVGIAGTF